jgi:hypothetical protein
MFLVYYTLLKFEIDIDYPSAQTDIFMLKQAVTGNRRRGVGFIKANMSKSNKK